MKAHRSRFSYPVFLNLDRIPVLVVGGGRIGWRKAEGLLDAGAIVRLVGADISEHVDVDWIVDAGGEVITASFDDCHLERQRLVVTATGNLETDAAISDAARARSIWTNAADQPVDCEFILPAITRAGRVTAAISTDGASPALAGFVRDRVAEILAAGVAEIADTLAAERAAVQAAGGSTEDIDWRPRLDELFAKHADVLPGVASR
ncbi:bifunctional precorrin-2 dehydrogenase/sirohydrochlorin ferrochelatase [Ilumatobacter sp.]|uniref:precorrin-2 dehydrogenase/sirohydrochlorin ferrochelatase family protein n=1 Tax=Ilumatobacter sp. TaxID=1967498 RepID=UPI0037519FFE